MQKKIIALAVAGLVSGAAFAQTNVTIYGAADVTFDNVKAGGASVLVVNNGIDAANSFSNLNQPGRNRVSANSSILGFRGTEDLGGGLKALFQFEGSVASDAGGPLSFVRDTFVGIQGGFGRISAGLQSGPTRSLGATMDPFLGSTGITSNAALLGKFGGLTGISANPYYVFPATAGNDNTLANATAELASAGYCSTVGATCASVFDTRFANSVAYTSPNFGGLTASAVYVAGENKSRGEVVNKVNGKGYDLGLRYANGPILAGLTYNKLKLGDNFSTELADTRLAARYNFGMATVGLMWDRVKWSETGWSGKRTAWFLPVTFNVTPAGKIVAQYGKAGDVSGESNTGATMFALGYEHSLSKRTVVKAVWSQISNDKAALYDFGVNSVGGIMPGADPKGFQVGVRHSF
jgi:predicted porin